MTEPKKMPAEIAEAAKALQRLAESLGLSCLAGDVERRLAQTWPDAGEAPIREIEWFARAAEDQGLRVQRRAGSLDEALAHVTLGQGIALQSAALERGRYWIAVLRERGGKFEIERFGSAAAPALEGRLSKAELGTECGLQPGSNLEWVALDLATPLDQATSGHGEPTMTEWKRLMALVKPDSSDILSITIFAIAIGVLQLATPVAAQALVNFVALGGAIPPVIAVAFMLMLGLAFAGALSALQTWIVEVLQRRIFVRTFADLAARLPRVRDGAHHYGPELVNRFLDIVSVQKLGAGLLLDGIALLLTVVVGLVLLAFYHPLLLAFDLVLLVVIALLVFVPLRRGVQTAIDESTVKFQAAAWLEEVARNPRLFKSSGAQRWALDTADRIAGEYVAKRRRHFRIVFGQVIGAQALRMIASTALLAIGGILVIRGALTLGQLVAAEIIVSLVVDSVAKTGKHLENYYDLMAATGKVGKLLDLPLEPHSGEHHSPNSDAAGATLTLSQVAATRSSGAQLFGGVELELPAGGVLCVRGASGAGKSTFTSLLWGLRSPSRGAIRLDGRDLRELACDSLRRNVALVSGVELVHASIRDNVRIGRTAVSDDDVRDALRRVGLLDELAVLPQGLDTELDALGHPLSEGQSQRLLIARAIAGQPRLLVIDDVLDALPRDAARTVEASLFDPKARWTLVLVSNRAEIAARSTLVLDLPSGQVSAPSSPNAPKVA
jgi:putative ABC transport system ATP-binding protein